MPLNKETKSNQTIHHVISFISTFNKNSNLMESIFIYFSSKLLMVSVGWVGFYGISTFVGYLTADPFLFK